MIDNVKLINERNSMKYETTGKKTNKDTAKNAEEYEIRKMSLTKMLWVKTRQHKYALSVTLNIIFAIYFFLPFLPGEIVSIVTGN